MMDQSLQQLTTLMIEGRIAPEQQATLETQLRQSAEARRDYLRRLDAHAALQWTFRGKGQPVEATQPVTPVQPRRRWIGVLSAAAMLALVAALALVYYSQTDQPPADGQPVASPAVASLTASTEVIWAGDSSVGDHTHQGSLLKPGVVELEWGVTQLLFERGATVSLRGPARFEMIDANTCRLTRGELMAYVPRTAHGFTVITPDGTRVIDRGTQFVVRIDEVGRTRVDVLEGRVDLSMPGGARPRPISAGDAAVVSGHGTIDTVPIERPILQRFNPTATQLYQQRVLFEQPLVYWPLTENGQSHGVHELPIPAEALRFDRDGLIPGDPAAALTMPGRIDTADRPLPRFDQAMTVEAWVRLAEPIQNEAVMRLISVDGFSSNTHGGWGVALLGQNTLRFTHYGQQDYDASIDTLPLDTWVHLAVVASDQTMRFYVDGQPVDNQPIVSSIQYHPQLKLTLGSLGDGRERFTGHIAHLAVYDRPLTEKQIKSHHRIGNPR